MLRKLLGVALLIAGTAFCAQTPVSNNPPGDSPGLPSGSVGTQDGDWAAILKLEGEAKAIAKATGCTSGECRSAPVGSRACGGPRYYLVYCAKSTDSVALNRKLDEVAKAEQVFNRKYNIVSSCDFRMPPDVQVVAGACVAK
jgi:hypothetical protein